MPEREVEADKDDKAVGIMKAIVLQEHDKEITFAIRKGGQEKLHKHFISFYANRKGYEGKPQAKEDPELKKMQAVPQISEKTKQYAEKARKKMYGETAAAHIVMQLYEKEKVRQAKNEIKANKIKEERESQQ